MDILKKLLKYYLLMIAIFFIGRMGLYIWQYNNFSSDNVNSVLSFLYGLKIDTMTASVLLIIPLLILSFTPKSLSNVANLFLRLYFLIVFGLILFIEIATFPFFAEYDVRPNIKFVEYLDYPKEVFNLIITDYKLPLFIAFVVIGLFSYIYLKVSKNEFIDTLKTSLLKRAVWFLPLGLILFMGIRSSFGHRPANISDVMYSSNRIVNEISKNSLYSVGYAIYANKKFSAQVAKLYGKMDIQEALKRVSKALKIESNDINGTSPFSRLEQTRFKSNKKKNLVIFLQESLGYQFISPQITPHLLKLKKEGLWFDECYSNGTRSVRGIAGVTSGFLAVPGKGVVKRPKSQHNFFTFASLLKPLGYHSMFIYGGEARFDNMRSWFLGNGFDEVIEQKDYKNPSFVATWGVSDEDLVIKANEKFNALYKEGKPFAALMFSSSNHKPFEVPLEKIKPLVKEGYCVENAVKFADFAIGKFFELAKKSPYFKDTVFVVVADHNVRVYGKEVVPVKMFHIPALIIANNLKPKNYDKLTSQPDILATALDLLGKDFRYPILGKSIFSDKKANLNLMQFNRNYALRVGNKVAVLVPNKKAQTFIYKDGKLIKTAHDKELEKDVLAFVTALNYLYDKQKYK
jgi:phosphoglycerol transferase MdoB-like AlkP superfamily enzyme